MKKITTISIVFFGVIFLAGCGQKTISQIQSTRETNLNQQKEKVTTDKQLSMDINSWNNYENKKYNFSIKYPKDWMISEGKEFAGPLFMSGKLTMENIQAEKVDKINDCYFNIAFLQVRKDNKIPCKNNLGEVVLGQNKFTKCRMTSIQDNAVNISYMLIHPKTSNVFAFQYLDNPSCQSVFEKSLETLTFN